MLRWRQFGEKSHYVFAGQTGEPFLGTSLNHQHQKVSAALKLSKDFVIHSLRHTMLTRLGEAGADAFTIMRIAGHSGVVVSQRYVHPTPELLERAFERLEALNGKMDSGAMEMSVLRGATTVSTTVGERLSVSH
jgi:integrase